MVASVADRPPTTFRIVTIQGVFLARAATSLRGRASHPTFKEIPRTNVHSNHYRTHNRPTHHEPVYHQTHHHADNSPRTQRRQQAPHHDGRRQALLHVAGRPEDPRP